MATKKFYSSRGATMVEMAIIVGLVLTVCVIGVTATGKSSRERMCDAAAGTNTNGMGLGQQDMKWDEVNACCAYFAAGGWGGGTWTCL